jgi:GT2 family glycosyltransferase
LAGDLLPDEIAIVDQSEIPNSRLQALAETQAVIRYFHSATRGLSSARNEAVRLARHDILIFLDDDMWVSRDWARVMTAKQVALGPDAVLSGRVLPSPEGAPGSVCPSTIEDATPATYRKGSALHVLYSGNMCMYRSMFQRVGTFDERLGPGQFLAAAEDNDYCIRIFGCSGFIEYFPDAVVYHRGWRSSLAGLGWAYGRGQGGFYAKHMLKDHSIASQLARQVVRRTRRVLKALGTKATRQHLAPDLAYLCGLAIGLLAWAVVIGRRPGPESSVVAQVIRP